MKSKFNHVNSHLNIKWKLDFDRAPLFENFEERNWERVEIDSEDFHFYWATVTTIRQIFNPKFKIRLG